MVTRTAGSERGPGRRAGSNPGTAPRAYSAEILEAYDATGVAHSAAPLRCAGMRGRRMRVGW